MSLSNNKADFEKALEEMKDDIEALDNCLCNEIMDRLKSVIEEYETHYESDIQELIDENESMKDKLCI
jgi:hypothetical protein